MTSVHFLYTVNVLFFDIAIFVPNIQSGDVESMVRGSDAILPSPALRGQGTLLHYRNNFMCVRIIDDYVHG